MTETRALEGGTGTWTVEGENGEAAAVHVRTCRLEVVSGPDTGLTRDFSTPVTRIGRTDADLPLTDRKVSGVHVELRLEETGFRVRDLGSTNGTWIRGIRIADAFVAPGTALAIGESVVRFSPLETSVEMRLWPEPHYGNMVGRSTAMRRIFAAIDRVARTDATVLVSGESGCGKELVAEALHDQSPRAAAPFVVLDCGSVPPTLFESHVFGHEKGAFTGAVAAREGVFELAHGGTLFLDEIGELPLPMQAKLLRAIETRRVRRVGGDRWIPCDVRIVAATHRKLAEEINRGAFRSDLYYRLAVVEIEVPPLRDRMQDLDLILDAIVRGRGALPTEFLEWARRASWPGNVRQLRNAVERTLALHSFIPDPWQQQFAVKSDALGVDVTIPFREAKQRLIDEFDRRYVTELLELHRHNVSAAARAAGLDRMTIYKILNRLRLSDHLAEKKTSQETP